MNTEEPLDFDDLGEALREGRALRPARGYRFRFALNDLNFHDLVVADPMPVGRQIYPPRGSTRMMGTVSSPYCPKAISRMCGLMSRLTSASAAQNGLWRS